MKTTRPLIFLPESKNFSAFRENSLDQNNSEDPLAYDVSDEGRQANEAVSILQAEELLLSLLSNLDDRGKVILLYQVMKEMGYSITQEEYAATLNTSRVRYSFIKKKVIQKCMKMVVDASKQV